MGAESSVATGAGEDRATARHGAIGAEEASIDRAQPHVIGWNRRCVCAGCEPPAYDTAEIAPDRADAAAAHPRQEPATESTGSETATSVLPLQETAAAAAPRYSWSTDQERFYGDCASREEAIAEALDEDPEDAEGDPRTRVWTGLCVPVVPTAGFDAATVIDDIRGAVFDDVSDEVVPDDWPAVDRAAELELEEALEAVVVDWVARHAPPTFWSVEQVREHQVEPPPSGGEPVPDEPPQVIVDPTRCTECGDGHCSGCDWEQPGPAPAAVDATGHERTCLVVVHQVSERDAQELSLCTCGAARADRAA